MTKNEYDYERMLKQMEELQKKMTEKKEILDKEDIHYVLHLRCICYGYTIPTVEGYWI